MLQRMNHIFTFIDSVLFKRKQEVLLSFTHGEHQCAEGQTAESRAMAAEKKKNQEQNVQPEKKKGKIVFSDLRHPQKNFTPLFGEVANFGALTDNKEEKSRDVDEIAHCLPQNT